MVLFRRRDCAGGRGPAVDAPSVDAAGAVVTGAVADGAAVAVVVGAWEADEADVVPKPWNRLGAGWPDVAVAEELPEPDAELVVGLNWNKPPLLVVPVEGGCDAAGGPIPKSGFDALVSVAVDAGVEAGALEVVVFWLGKENAGFGVPESEGVEPGIEKREGAAWFDVDALTNSEAVEVDGAEEDEGWPRLKNDFGASAVVVGAVEVSFDDSDGLLKPWKIGDPVPAGLLPKRPPPPVPAVLPKRLRVDEGWLLELDAAVVGCACCPCFCPNNPPPCCPELFPKRLPELSELAPKAFEGGGPAGVVEGPPNENVGADVDGAGVVDPDEAAEVLPNIELGAPPVDAPKSPDVWLVPEVVGAVVFAGVWRVLPKPPPNNEGVFPVLLLSSGFWLSFNLKPGNGLPPPCWPNKLPELPEPPVGAAPNREFFSSGFEVAGGLPKPLNEKPLPPGVLFPLPKRLPPFPALLAVPKRDELADPLVVGAPPKLNFGASDMLRFVWLLPSEKISSTLPSRSSLETATS
jgi:hypothetical protein